MKIFCSFSLHHVSVYSHVRYEVLIVVPLKMKVFCDARLCHWANGSCCFFW